MFWQLPYLVPDRKLLRQGKKLEVSHVMDREDPIDRFRSSLAATFPSLFRQNILLCCDKVDVVKRKQIARSSGLDLISLDDLEARLEEIRMGYFTNTPSPRKTKKYLMEQLLVRGHKRSKIAERLGVTRKTVYNILG